MADGAETSGKAQPFGALIAASSLIAAVLYLAGFSYRWAYFYNFGVPHLVFNLSYQSILTASMEMIKLPMNLLLTTMSLLATLLVINLVIAIVQRLAAPNSPLKWKWSIAAARLLDFDKPLVTDSIRAAAIFYVVYMLSSQMGYWQFKKQVVNSPNNSLPAVSAIVQGEHNQEMALACGKEWKSLPDLIGDAELVRNIVDYHRTCALNGTIWRLLYRDDKSIYLFASELEQKGKPLTIVLPNTEKTILVLE